MACAVLVAAGYLTWRYARPRPCRGAVFIELRPPLTEPGRYRFLLALDGGSERCELELPLPIPAHLKKPNCRMPLEFSTRERDGRTSVVALTLGAEPESFTFKMQKDGEPIYDTSLTPKYAPYEIRRADNPRFCGEQAYLEPVCLQGSSVCSPFPVRCGDACVSPKVCCGWPDWGHEYGVNAATDCVSATNCLDRLGHVLCAADNECPSPMTCSDDALSAAFRPPKRACK
jgi:hypothetical protein